MNSIAEENWKWYVFQVLYALQFDFLPASEETVSKIHSLIQDLDENFPPQKIERVQVKRAIAAALASDVQLSQLLPQPHSEEALRAFLKNIIER